LVFISDLFGFALFLYLMFWTFQNYNLEDFGDKVVFAVFFIGAQVTFYSFILSFKLMADFFFIFSQQCQMLFSTLYHWFMCMSPELYKFLSKLDYAGINILIVASYCSSSIFLSPFFFCNNSLALFPSDPPLYYAFYCEAIWQYSYLIGISLLGLGGIICLSLDRFNGPRFRVFRTCEHNFSSLLHQDTKQHFSPFVCGSSSSRDRVLCDYSCSTSFCSS
jgi:predicted membrane channel-forming protein YqfA (hemolysin III family)